MLNTRGHLLASDLTEIIDESIDSLRQLANSRILIMGGTGFVGTWISSALMEANQKYSLNLHLSLLTRNQFLAVQKLNLESIDKVQLIEHDVRNPFPKNLGTFDYYIHGATPSTKNTGSSSPDLVVDSSITGMKNLLEFISRGNVAPSVMHLSSGAVYGDPYLKVKSVSESEPTGGVSSMITPYTFAKIETEKLILEATKNNLIRGTNPRLFAFGGPHIALDQHFAVGNFLQDRLEGKRISIRGNPQTIRSYMYPTDMCIWLFALLVNPTVETIHIGSNVPTSMSKLAGVINECTQGKDIEYLGLDSQASCYVPETFKTMQNLNVVQKVSLEDAIMRWWKWIHETNR